MNDENNKDIREPDGALWNNYVRDVKPIKRDSATKKAVVTKNAQPDDSAAKIKQPLSKSDSSAHETMLMSPQPLKSGDGSPSQLDRRTAQKLKRGQFPIEDKIDLHGMTRDAACVALQGFIVKAYAQQLRCVLVVTGKGRLTLDRDDQPVHVQARTPGVIKRNFKSWLAGEPYRSMILKIETAQIKDGGEGAAYILLRRQR